MSAGAGSQSSVDVHTLLFESEALSPVGAVSHHAPLHHVCGRREKGGERGEEGGREKEGRRRERRREGEE